MRTRNRGPALWPGLILISVGGGLLAREFGYLPPRVRVWDFWPLFVVFLGVSTLVHRRGFLGASFALGFILMGGLLLAGNLGFLAFNAARLWPAFLVLLGLAWLFGAGRRRSHGGPLWKPPDGDDSGARAYGAHRSGHPDHFGAQTSSEDRINKQITLSGAQLRIESEAWKGGELGTTAGGSSSTFGMRDWTPQARCSTCECSWAAWTSAFPTPGRY
jgi:hypothetical protein